MYDLEGSNDVDPQGRNLTIVGAIHSENVLPDFVSS
jgi:hypothetical protein